MKTNKIFWEGYVGSIHLEETMEYYLNGVPPLGS